MRFIGFLALLLLAGCAQKITEVRGSTPASISIYANSLVSDEEITNQAQAHCASHEANARRTVTDMCIVNGRPSNKCRTITFECVKPE